MTHQKSQPQVGTEAIEARPVVSIVNDADLSSAHLRKLMTKVAKTDDPVVLKTMLAQVEGLVLTAKKLHDEKSDVVKRVKGVRADTLARLGEVLQATDLSKGGRPRKTGTDAEPVSGAPATLSELGISKKTSAEAQKLADFKRKSPRHFRRIVKGEASLSIALGKKARIAAEPRLDHLAGNLTWRVTYQKGMTSDERLALLKLHAAITELLHRDDAARAVVDQGTGARAEPVSDDDVPVRPFHRSGVVDAEDVVVAEVRVH